VQTDPTQSVKVVVGADEVFDLGWIPTDKESLNLLSPDGWDQRFLVNSIDAILAEHVWEHLTFDEGVIAAITCFKYLKPGGHVRVAVPDGLHPDQSYLELVKPGGTGSGAWDHKVLYTYKALRELFERTGFDVELLEYFDEAGKFFFNPWERVDGMIHRSIRYDERNHDGNPHYTSIILDARKPKTEVERPELRWLSPVSQNWGWERGGSIDRYYIDPFLNAALSERSGRFLEFGSPTYMRFVEPGNIELYDIIDIDQYNPEATIISDIQTLPSSLNNTFDVIICTQVLQLVQRPELAVRRMREALRPNGLLILSVPFISKIMHDTLTVGALVCKPSRIC
jgi:predicted SAM-dependent methyltransferase